MARALGYRLLLPGESGLMPVEGPNREHGSRRVHGLTHFRARERKAAN
jgi:hypothetical protein